MAITWVITSISLLFQIVTLVLAIRLFLHPARRQAGFLVSFIILLMAFRRAISLFHALHGDTHPTDLLAEGVACAISLLMLIGILYLGRLLDAWENAKAAFSDADKRLKAIIDAEPECVKVLDRTGRLLLMNPAGLAMIDAASFDQVREQCVFPLITPRFRDAFIALTNRIFEGQSGTLEFEAIGLKGRSVWLETHAVPLRDERGNIHSLLGVTRDVTRSRQLEREREQFFKFFQTSSDLMVIADPNGAFRQVNPACLAALGYSESELLSKPFIDFVHPEDKPATLKEMEQQQITGKTLKFDNRYLCKDGSVRWLSWRASFSKAEGITYASARDYTEQKRAEEELEAFFTLASDLMCIADFEGHFKKVNPSWEKTLGYSKDEFIRTSYFDLLHPDDVEKTREIVNSQLARGLTVINFENRYRCKNGDYKWLAWTSNPVVEAGLTYAIARDVTERKRAEERLARSLQEKEVMLKEIHHRVKNNMQVISSLLSLQARGIADDKVRVVFEESRNRVASMALIHERLYGSPDLAHIDFQTYLNGLMSSIRETYHRKDIIFSVVVPQAIALDVNLGIPCGLIVNELVSNSMKYAFPNNRSGLVEVGLRQQGSESVTLEVRDNGVGLPATVDFDNPSTLGLQLVKVLSHQIFGKIEVSRQEGTRFVMTFPVPK